VTAASYGEASSQPGHQLEEAAQAEGTEALSEFVATYRPRKPSRARRGAGAVSAEFGRLSIRDKVRVTSVVVCAIAIGSILLKLQTGFGGDRIAAFAVLAVIGSFVAFQFAPAASRGGGNSGGGELKRVTANWTLPILVRKYAGNGGGQRKFESEAGQLVAHGYSIAGQSGVGSHINVGRTAGPALLTGGLSLVAGASRSSGDLTVTYQKAY
jgi:hypothetical protein